MEEFAPKADIKEVGDGMVGTDVNVSRRPILNGLFIPSVIFVMRGGVAPEIP